MDSTGVMPVVDMNRNNDCYGGGAMFMWVIVIFALLGGWGFNRGNNGSDAAAVFANGAMTRNEVSSGFDFQTLDRGIRGIQNGLADGFYAQNSGILNLEKSVLQNGFGIEKTVMQGDNQLGAGLAENRFAMQNGFCEVNRSIDALKADAYKNTCEITNAIHGEAEKTRALITGNAIQELRDKLADRDRDLQNATFQLSQVAQTARLTETLRPFPQPAYITNSPYTGASSVYGYCGGVA